MTVRLCEVARHVSFQDESCSACARHGKPDCSDIRHAGTEARVQLHGSTARQEVTS
jgi:hypothetical protein